MTDKIAPVYDTVDAAPEGLRPFLVEHNGKQVVNIDVNAHPEVAGLKSAFEKQKGLAQERLGKLEPWQKIATELELSPDAVRELHEKMTKNPPKNQAEIDSAIKQVQAKYEGQVTDLTKKIATGTATIDRLVRRGDAVSAIAKYEGNELFLLPHVLSQTKVVYENDEPITVVINKDGTERLKDALGNRMTVDDLVAEMSGKKEYEAAFPGKLPSGSGAKNTPNRPGAAGAVRISRADARDGRKYQEAKARADKAGVELEFID